jgi:hypothetical protein
MMHDALAEGAVLLPGTVTTTHGSVVVGNAPGDQEVTVDVGAVTDGSTITIRYLARVAPVLVKHASATLVSGGGFPREVLSDDPQTTDVGDPTATAVQCPGQGGQGACCEPLDECWWTR